MLRCRTVSLALVLSLAVAGCQRQVHVLAESRSARFGRAQLMTRFVEHRPTGRVVPLVHILFVPDWDIPPRVAHSVGHSHGGTINRLKFNCTFQHDGTEVTAQPIHVVDAATVEAAGRSWDLRAGNVFVALVNPDGTLRITQLSTDESSAQQIESSSEGVLAFIKQSLPAEPRVQMLEAKPW